jgi:calcineurin-like phosphoesterase family protein
MWLRDFFGNIFHRRNVFLISDTHFDHTNIIKYCHRPFASTKEMNKAMVDNWNIAVKENDVVYFLGDWGYGKGHRSASYWKGRLNGNIMSIQGINSRGHAHDEHGLPYKIVKSKRHKFLLIHDPNGRRNWNGWTIHGHMHNNQPNKYPFINGHQKTINVCVELTDYTPISLDVLEALNIDSIKWMRTSNSAPERW